MFVPINSLSLSLSSEQHLKQALSGHTLPCFRSAFVQRYVSQTNCIPTLNHKRNTGIPIDDVRSVFFFFDLFEKILIRILLNRSSQVNVFEQSSG